ncbi:MAG: WGR domain-containing protein [Verrucomicrobiaceae bacterium]|nr:MAG: WGR domain-containing protein [Verrucomicrobiaceae bacterium]
MPSSITLPLRGLVTGSPALRSRPPSSPPCMPVSPAEENRSRQTSSRRWPRRSPGHRDGNRDRRPAPVGQRPREKRRFRDKYQGSAYQTHPRQLTSNPFGKDRRGKPVRTTRPARDGATHGPPRTAGLSLAARILLTQTNNPPQIETMNQTTIQSTSLHYREGSSDKVYHAAIEPKDDGYVVTFAYGRRGSTLATGTKTEQPVPLATATTLFNKLVASQVAKGYKPDEDAQAPYAQSGQEGIDTGVRCQLLNAVDIDGLSLLLGDIGNLIEMNTMGQRFIPNASAESLPGSDRSRTSAVSHLDICHINQLLGHFGAAAKNPALQSQRIFCRGSVQL